MTRISKIDRNWLRCTIVAAASLLVTACVGVTYSEPYPSHSYSYYYYPYPTYSYSYGYYAYTPAPPPPFYVSRHYYRYRDSPHHR